MGYVTRLFQTVGAFKGMIRLTSKFPSGWDSWTTYRLLTQFLRFVLEMEDHMGLDFANESQYKKLISMGQCGEMCLQAVYRIHNGGKIEETIQHYIISQHKVKGDLTSGNVILKEFSNIALYLQFVMFLI